MPTRRRNRGIAQLLPVLLGAFAGEVDAQAMFQLSRERIEGVDHEFSRIVSARELSSGVVLVADEKEDRILSVDFRSGVVRDIARRGDGPGEFSQASRVFALPGDTSIMVDGPRRRWIVFVGSNAVATISAREPVVAATGMMLLQGFAGGGKGVFVEYPGMAAGRTDPTKEGPAVVIADRRSGSVSRVTTARHAMDPRNAPSGSGPGRVGQPSRSTAQARIGLRVIDQVAAAPDGSASSLGTIRIESNDAYPVLSVKQVRLSRVKFGE
jgi:hypothetical protein